MVRGRWAPLPMEGKGPREGQRMAIDQWAPPAVGENNTPKQHAEALQIVGPVSQTVCQAPKDCLSRRHTTVCHAPTQAAVTPLQIVCHAPTQLTQLPVVSH